MIRFFLQTYYDLDLYAMINLATADWSPDRAVITYSNILSCIVLVTVVLVPFVLIRVHTKAG